MSSTQIIIKTCQRYFSFVGISSPTLDPTYIQGYQDWLADDLAGDLAYMKHLPHKRFTPSLSLTDCESVIVLCSPYYNHPLPLSQDKYQIAKYAKGLDYHEFLNKKLTKLILRLKNHFPTASFKHYTDTGPLLERAYCAQSGLGFFGRNTNIIHEHYGSYFFISLILTTLDLAKTPPPLVKKGCGTCTRCIDICPTHALISEYKLDAKKCISYLTIENKGSIPEKLRPLIGNHLFGCDDCQDICPYNTLAKKSGILPDPALIKPVLGTPQTLKEILAISDDQTFRQKYAGTPFLRSKRRGLLRNAAVVAGNTKARELLPRLLELSKHDPDEIIREHANWAVQQITQSCTKVLKTP